MAIVGCMVLYMVMCFAIDAVCDRIGISLELTIYDW